MVSATAYAIYVALVNRSNVLRSMWLHANNMQNIMQFFMFELFINSVDPIFTYESSGSGLWTVNSTFRCLVHYLTSPGRLQPGVSQLPSGQGKWCIIHLTSVLTTWMHLILVHWLCKLSPGWLKLMIMVAGGKRREGNTLAETLMAMKMCSREGLNDLLLN